MNWLESALRGVPLITRLVLIALLVIPLGLLAYEFGFSLAMHIGTDGLMHHSP
jgi:hypothetical protein